MAHTITFVDSPWTQYRISIPIYIQGTGRHSLTHSPLVVVAAINLLCLTRADTCPLRSSTSPSPPFGFRFRKRNGRLFLIRLVIQILPFQLHNSFLFLFIILIIFRFRFVLLVLAILLLLMEKGFKFQPSNERINKQVSGAQNPW
jgi:hypothetical protein